MEVEVQHAEYGGNGWLHFLITNFIVSPSSRGEFLSHLKVVPDTDLGIKL